ALIPFVSACVVAAVLVPSASDPELFTEGDFTRFAWFAVHPITAATHLGLALILLTHARLKRGTGAFTMLVGMGFAAALVATYSRGPLIACLVGLATLVISRGRHVRLIAVLTTLLVAVILTVMLMVDVGAMVEEYAPAFLLRGQDAEALTSFTGRSDL